MLASLLALALVSFFAPTATPLPQPLPPLPPDTSLPAHMEEIAKEVSSELAAAQTAPARIRIPSVGIDSPVIEVGVNAAGEMDVPDGRTNLVGWYKYGVRPGERGSAVMDAHVYAAFKRLKHANVGSTIEITNADGTVRTFKIISSKVYPLERVPMDIIFTDTSGTYLNLITCEGRYSIARGTYDHRRVVYAELLE